MAKVGAKRPECAEEPFRRGPIFDSMRGLEPLVVDTFRGVGARFVLPRVNIHAMNLHLQEISNPVSQDALAMLTLDGAGWHQLGDRLVVPDNIGPLHLPPYSPELNPVENIWEFLRQNDLSNRVYATYEEIVDACCVAWNKLIAAPERIRSIATRDWTKPVSS